jgi:hypothetical protein
MSVHEIKKRSWRQISTLRNLKSPVSTFPFRWNFVSFVHAMRRSIWQYARGSPGEFSRSRGSPGNFACRPTVGKSRELVHCISSEVGECVLIINIDGLKIVLVAICSLTRTINTHFCVLLAAVDQIWLVEERKIPVTTDLDSLWCICHCRRHKTLLRPTRWYEGNF